MFAKAANSTPAVPSRNALRVLRQLAFAGSTVGSFCTLAVITYDSHRRVRVAEQIIENKRILHTSAPNYDATASAQRLATMMEAAEAGEFMGLASLKDRKPRRAGDAEVPLTENTNPTDPLRPRARSLPKWAQSGPRELSARRTPDRLDEIAARARNRVALAREAKEASEARAAGDIPLEDKVCDLLKEDREIEAATLFIKHTQPETDERVPVSLERQDLMRTLFVANCVKGNIFLARALFEHMEKVSEVDEEIWSTMMHLLAKEGHIESVGAIFERHQAKFTVPNYMLEVVLRCLLESRRLSGAKFLFYARIKHDAGGGLCGTYLDGLWKKTRKIDLINAEFHQILSALEELELRPTEKIFNPLVKAYTEAGNFEEAEALVADMAAKFGVKPGCRTFGLLVYSRALTCDWEAVMNGLHEMHELGFTTDHRQFARVFDRVLLEYYPVHSGPQILDFVMTCLNQFNIRPDRVLHRHILEALIERGDPSAISQITRLAEEHKWNTGFDQHDLIRTLEARRISMQGTPVGFWRMLQAAKKQYGMATSSRRLMGHSADYYSLEDGALRPNRKASETYPQTVNRLVDKRKSMAVHMPLHKRQEHYIHAGKFTKAIKDFNKANKSGHHIKAIHIKLAVIAKILNNGLGSLEDAQKTIKDEWHYWSRVPTIQNNPRFPQFVPIFFQQILQIERNSIREAALLKMALFEFYNICDDASHLNVKNHAAVSLARNLISQRRPRIASQVLMALYQSKWRKIYDFDQVLIKILLRAFANFGDARGVWWCLLTVISRKEIVLPEFVVEAKRLMPTLEGKLHDQSPGSEHSHNLAVLRKVLIVLEQKASGLGNWATIHSAPDLKAQGRAKPASRSLKEQKLLPSASVAEVARSFDEEMEMDFLVSRKPVQRSALGRIWDEHRMVTASRLQPEDPQYPHARSEAQ
ncbi:hypothetical protein N7462_003349 [Penicillium macrosclerotiorum]|uniref:uncharacterized protein n=1 Tax=Penicillium macrosclerotiorum TaxID=303699 RepID=UPI002548E01D|nr:uncharacterized protein N7462_003349 [Penicillium macrosclerotiorum]KAJ5688957.1 hypothetical protein N7462_003349 [Penicillium macrosclerotiorum]